MSDSAFFKAMDVGTGNDPFKKKVVGEKGGPEHSMYGMAGISGTETQGALTAIFNKILRDTSKEQIGDLVENIFVQSNKEGCLADAVVELFCIWAQLRDREDGKGERKVSYYLFLEMFQRYPVTSLKLIKLYPFYGYWKDLSQLYLLADGESYSSIRKEIEMIFAKQLTEDHRTYNTWIKNGKKNKLKISLCAKYVPKENKSFDKKTGISHKIANCLFHNCLFHDCYPTKTLMRKFRQYVSRLNRAINTVEILECSGNYDKINPVKVPSRCLSIKKRAFLNLKGNCGSEIRYPEDEKRMVCRKNFLDFIELSKTGKASFKGRMMFIHELVKQLMYRGFCDISNEEEAIIESQWNSHVMYFKKMMQENNTSLGKGIVLADVSESMLGIPMNVSIALAIFVSSLAHPAFRDKFISFETEPRWISLRYPRTYEEFRRTRGFDTPWEPSRKGGELTLKEKVHVASSSPWGGSTNFEKAHELILRSCVESKISSDEMPEWFLIASDMQFDEARNPLNYKLGTHDKWETIHEGLEKKYAKSGMDAVGIPYKVPQQIYWNLRGNTVGFPVQSDTPNTQMISGFNVSVLKQFLSGDEFSFEPPTPWDTLVSALSNKRYNLVRQKCSESDEKTLVHFKFSVITWTASDDIRTKSDKGFSDDSVGDEKGEKTAPKLPSDWVNIE